MYSAKWDARFIAMAQLVSTWSKDPSTQVGAVVADADRRVVSIGFNGLPKNIEDMEERYNNRELKYKMIIHAERNALLFAQRSLKGCSIYTYPVPPCSVCAGLIIQMDIVRVVSPPITTDFSWRWGEDIDLALKMFREAQIMTVVM